MHKGYKLTTYLWLFGLILITHTSCKLLFGSLSDNPNETFNTLSDENPYDAIIVPGCPHDSNSLRLLLDRVYWASFLHKKGLTKKIIFSGSAVYTPYYESKVMRLIAIKLGVPSEDIHLESNAEHTTENVYYGYKICDSLGYKRRAFATQSFQAGSMVQFVKRYDLNVDMLPIIADSIAHYTINTDSMDLTEAYCQNWTSLVQRESFLKRLRGTMGRRVKAEIRQKRKEE